MVLFNCYDPVWTLPEYQNDSELEVLKNLQKRSFKIAVRFADKQIKIKHFNLFCLYWFLLFLLNFSSFQFSQTFPSFYWSITTKDVHFGCLINMSLNSVDRCCLIKGLKKMHTICSVWWFFLAINKNACVVSFTRPFKVQTQVKIILNTACMDRMICDPW